MSQITFFLSFNLVLQFEVTYSWILTPKNHKFKPDDWNTEDNKRLYEDKCVCGKDQPHFPKPWSVFILALLKDTEYRRLNHMRRCVGTLINSNMVVTSHKCLAEQLNQKINIYNAWINNYTLPIERLYITRSVLIEGDLFPVKDIIINTRYAYNQVKEIFPGSDMAILVLSDTNVLEKMIPVCLPEYKRDINVIYQIGYFYGVGGLLESDITEETRSATGVPILSGPECDEERGGVHYHLKASNESFCIRYPTLAPRSPGGPLIIGVGESGTSVKNVTAFIVGLSSKTYYRNAKQFYNYVYFTNLLDETKYIERVANIHGSKWCRPHQNAELNLPEKDPVPKPKQYKFRNIKESNRDESLNCVCGITNSNPLKIVGGEEAIPYEFGWQVKLLNQFYPNDWSYCGGAIINDRMILTAGHCLFSNSSGGFAINTKVLAKIHDFEGDPKQLLLPVKKVFVHPAYLFGSTHDVQIIDSDIAVIILEERIHFAAGTHEGNVSVKDIRPICLPEIGQKIEVVGKEAVLAGWGLIEYIKDPNIRPPRADKLKKLRVPIKNLTECVRTGFGPVTDNVICYTSYNESGAAQGDSGGPLIIKEKGLWTVVGVTSWGSQGFDYDIIADEVENPTGTDPNFRPYINAYADVQKLLKFVEYYAKENDAKWCRSHLLTTNDHS